MRSITDRASVLRAVNDPELDLDLRALIGLRSQQLGNSTELYVVLGGDTAEVIDAALGFAITGDQPGEFAPEWIEDHGRWFEISCTISEGVSTRIFVENDPGTELGIHYLCLSYFWPGCDEPTP